MLIVSICDLMNFHSEDSILGWNFYRVKFQVENEKNVGIFRGTRKDTPGELYDAAKQVIIGSE